MYAAPCACTRVCLSERETEKENGKRNRDKVGEPLDVNIRKKNGGCLSFKTVKLTFGTTSKLRRQLQMHSHELCLLHDLSMLDTVPKIDL